LWHKYPVPSTRCGCLCLCALCAPVASVAFLPSSLLPLCAPSAALTALSTPLLLPPPPSPRSLSLALSESETERRRRLKLGDGETKNDDTESQRPSSRPWGTLDFSVLLDSRIMLQLQLLLPSKKSTPPCPPRAHRVISSQPSHGGDGAVPGPDEFSEMLMRS